VVGCHHALVAEFCNLRYFATMAVEVAEAQELLEEILHKPVAVQDVGLAPGADAIFIVQGRAFIIEVKSDARSASIASAIAQLEDWRRLQSKKSDPLLVVRHMTDVGARLCAEHDVNWLDLEGNAEVDVPGIRVRIRGQKGGHAIAAPGVNAFSRSASRAVHALLIAPKRSWSRSELAFETGLDKGSLSRTLRALVEQGYVTTRREGRLEKLSVNEWSTLLDAWVEHYRAPNPTTIGLVASRRGEETLEKVRDVFVSHGIEPIFTGLPAAAAYTNFGAFRRVRLYVDKVPNRDIRARLNVTEDTRGRNVIVNVNDENARIGAREMGAFAYVSPILAYLDLHDEPERADEAREELRRVIRDMWR
jgi:hypothetical protein